MSLGLRNSTIERFRLRYHGNCILRFLRLADDGQSYTITATIEKGYFLSRLGESDLNGLDARLTVDLIYTPTVTGDDLNDSSFVDYVNPETQQFQRWRIRTDTPPQVDDWRYVLGLFSAFSDKRPVT